MPGELTYNRDLYYNRDTYVPPKKSAPQKPVSYQDQLTQFMQALSKEESGGHKDPYTTIGKKTAKGDHAYGKYQAMGEYIPGWTKQYLGKKMTIKQFLADPQAQEELMKKRAEDLYKKYNNWEDVANVHFTGQPRATSGDVKDVNGTSNTDYVGNIMKFMGQAAGEVSSTMKNLVAPTAYADTISSSGTSSQSSTPSQTPQPPQKQRTLQDAIQYAKQNPDSAFATELRNRIQSGQLNADAAKENITLPGQNLQQDRGNMFTNAVKSVGSYLQNDWQSTVDLATGNTSRQSTLENLGGAVDMFSNVAMLAGTFVLDTAAAPFSAGASEAAFPLEAGAEIVAKEGAQTAAKGAVRTGLEAFGKSKVGKAAGAFASGKGIGGAIQAIVQGGVSGAQTLGKGGTPQEALQAGLQTAAMDYTMLQVMNDVGAQVFNKFIDFVGKSKFATTVSGSLKKAATAVMSAANMGATDATGAAVKAKLQQASESVANGNSAALGGVLSHMKPPSDEAMGQMTDRVSQNVSVSGNAEVEAKFSAAKSALAPFVLTKDDIKTLAGQVGSLVPKSSQEIESMVQAEMDRITASKPPGATGDEYASGFREQAKKNVEAQQAEQGLLADAESTLQERMAGLVRNVEQGAKVTVEDAIDRMNLKSPDAIDASIKSGVWQMIRGKVAGNPEGEAALQDYTKAVTARAQQNEQGTLADTMRFAAGATDNVWQRTVSTLLGQMKDAGSVANLRKAMGDQFPQFQKMISQKAFMDAAHAYSSVISNAKNNLTPEVLAQAHTAMANVIDAYAKKFESLPGLMDGDRSAFLHDLKNGIPTLETVAKNMEIDPASIPGLSKDLGKFVQPEVLDTIKNSPVGKAIATGDFESLPTALMSSNKKTIQGLKQVLGENSPEWKMLSMSALGKVMQTAQGLWGNADAKLVQDTLEKVSAGVGGDMEKFKLLFGGEGEKIFSELGKYASALSKGKGTASKAAANALGSAFFFSIHHVYIGSVLAHKAVRDFLKKEDITLLQKVAGMSQAQMKQEFYAARAADPSSVLGGGFRDTLAKFFVILGNALGPAIKYEVAKKVGDAAGAVTQETPAPSP